MKDLKISYYFSKPNEKVFKSYSWKKVSCAISDYQGKVYFQMDRVEAPQAWSQLAIDVAASKYFRKKDVPQTGHENSVRQLIERVVLALQQQAVRQKYMNRSEALIFANELTHILLSQRGFFNSPVWFNCGLYSSYGIQGEGPLWHWNPKKNKVEMIHASYVYPQVSACFIQSIEDSIEGIFNLAKTEAMLFKYGSGSGTNFSTLRSKYEKLEGGGTSSGLISFLDVLDRGAGAVKSGGTTRRAAKMVILDVDHPEIAEFIQWKAHEEEKAKALIAAGFDQNLEGESYRTVSGQNANNSVRVTDAFMKAVKSKAQWSLRARTSQKIIQKIPASELWQKISRAAWSCADPGLQFHDQIQRWHTCPATEPIRASNPCSEYMFLDDSACNLASINLLKFLDDKNQFDLAGYVQTIRVLLIAQDLLVDLAGYPTQKIADRSHRFRPLGLGLCGLGAFLMSQAIPYDSKAGRSWASSLSAILTGVAYKTSAQLAAVKGPFKAYRKNQKSMLKVIRQHRQATRQISYEHLPSGKIIGSFVQQVWQDVLDLGQGHGFRNSQVTVMAPTGTIGLVLDCDTTGIEPEFSLVKHKKLAGGGELKLISTSFLRGLKTLGYDPQKIKDIEFYLQLNGTLENCPDIQEQHRTVFAGAMEISPRAHLEMMAAIQPLISGAISKTVNMPAASSPEQVAEVYWQAWQLGLKSIAIYRDGSKGSQPLTALKPHFEPITPKCLECGAPTELAGGCFRCVNCGTVIGCA